MKNIRKFMLSIFAPMLITFAAFVDIAFLFQSKIETNSAKIEEYAAQEIENYVPEQGSAFYAAHNNLTRTELLAENEDGEYDLAKLGSMVISLTQANKNALSSIGLKEDADLGTKANATLSATLDGDKINIVVSCQFGNRYVEASTDAEVIFGEHFTGGAPVKLSGTKILTNTNANKLMAVETYNAKIATVSAGSITFSYSTYGSSSADTVGRGIYMSGGTVYLTSLTMYRYNVTSLTNTVGGGVYMSKEGGTLNINSSTQIYGCKAQSGGGVYIGRGSSGTIDGTVESCTAGTDGGGIYSSSGNLTIRDGAAIKGCSAGSRGGGVYCSNVSDEGSFVMNGGCIGDSSFTSTASGSNNCSNSAPVGGGLYAEYIGLKFSDKDSPSIVGNYSSGNGAGIYLNSAVISNSSGFTVKYNYSLGFGGGIYTNYGGTFECISIFDNFGVQGGGIYSTATVTLQYMNIYGNTGGDAGGGIAVNGADLTLNGTIDIYNNNSLGNGGGIHVINGNLTIETGSCIYGNTADASGGGVYCDVTHDYDDTVMFNFHGGRIGDTRTSFPTNASRSNYAYRGGGIYLDGGVIFNMHTESSSGTDYPRIQGNYATDGGGIYADGSSYLSLGNFEIKYNTAEDNGGGVYASCGGMSGESSYTHNIISNNKATNGGGAYFYAMNATPSYLKFEGNNATNGGAVYAMSNSSKGVKTLTLGTNTVIGSTSVSSTATSSSYSNYASSFGGGVYTGDYIALTISSSNSYVYGNYAGNSGGGIYFHETAANNGTNPASLNMNAGHIGYNAASSDGGGINFFAVYGGFFMSGGSIICNKASNGGGIYLNPDSDAMTNTITGGSIGQQISSLNNAATSTSYSNYASSNGGGIYVTSAAILEISGASTYIGYNYAASGGGIYNNGQYTEFRGKLVGNGAVDGAGAYVNGGNFSMSYSSSVYPYVQYNKATESGGGVYASGAFVTFNGYSSSYGRISYNQAENGGGLYCINSSLSVTSGLIQNNNATTNGGGVYFYTTNATKTFTFSNGYIGNTAYNGTGPSSSDLPTSTGGNRAVTSGGGIYIKGTSGYVATMNYNAGYVCQNVAGTSGGGIYGDQYSTINVGTSSGTSNAQYICANYAYSSGGGVYLTGTSQKFYMYTGYLGYRTSVASTTAYSNRATTGAGLYVASNSPDIYINSSSNTPATYFAHVYGNYSTSHGGGIYGVSNAYIYLYGYGEVKYNRAGNSTSVYGSGIYYAVGTHLYVGGYAKVTGNVNNDTNKGQIYLANSSSYLSGHTTVGALQSTSNVIVYKNGATAGTATSTSYIYNSSTSSYQNAIISYLKVVYPYSESYKSWLAVSSNYVYIKDISNTQIKIELVEKPIINSLVKFIVDEFEDLELNVVPPELEIENHDVVLQIWIDEKQRILNSGSIKIVHEGDTDGDQLTA